MKFARSVKALALAGAVLFAPSLASAATLTYQNPSNIFGLNGSAAVHILSPRDIGTRAGGFALQGDISGDSAVETFTAWCLDIYTYISDGQNYNPTTTPFAASGVVLTTTQTDNIQALFNTGLFGLDLSVGSNSAGFQLALWELIYETDSLFDVTVGGIGGFWATSGNAAALSTANSLLDGLGDLPTGNYNLTFLESVGHKSQNLVTGNLLPDEVPSVPVPAAGMLLLSALFGTGMLARMRRRVTH